MADNAKQESKRVLRVFLCHASGDKPAVRELYQRLCAQGIDAWLDEEKLLPGLKWQSEIPEAVRASDVVIVCLSRKSVDKVGYVQKEIKLALDAADDQPEGHIFLIPAKLEECDVPGRLREWHWVNLFEERGFEWLMRALRARAADLGASLSQPQARADELPRSSDSSRSTAQAVTPSGSSDLSRTPTAQAVTASSPPSVSSIDRDEDRAELRRKLAEILRAKSPRLPVSAAPLSSQASVQAALASALRNRQVFGGIEFVRVPKGKFIMGSKDDNKLAWDNEKPQHTVEIPYDYGIARYPVTNEQFNKFVEATRRKHPWVSDWKSKRDHPVVEVSWHDAVAYCKWLNETLRGEIGDLVVRLPTEAEWEKAARGELGNEWPWGDEFDKTKCNSYEGYKRGTMPVGAYSPQGDSPYGAADMAGNVWGWCHSIYRPYPYKADDGREKESGSDDRVLRGGAWLSHWNRARAACRNWDPPVSCHYRVGLRVVVAPNSRF